MTQIETPVMVFSMNKDLLDTMPKRVKFARKEAGFNSQAEMAKKLGKTREAYAWYETSSNMPIEDLPKFHKETKFSIHWLITGEGDMFGRNKFQDILDELDKLDQKSLNAAKAVIKSLQS